MFEVSRKKKHLDTTESLQELTSDYFRTSDAWHSRTATDKVSATLINSVIMGQ
jgi:hypothetical protein